ncbi:hypothetical protein RUND412_010350 [Rhizina undulata]
MAHANLRKLILARPEILDLQFDSAAGRVARPELLILQYDPTYLPGLSLDALLLKNADMVGEAFEERESSLPVDLPSISPNISSSVKSLGTLPHLGSEVLTLEKESRLLEDVDFEFDENEFGEEAEFEFFGAGVSVDTQAVQGNKWLNDKMEKESGNCFEYLKTELAKRQEEAEDKESTSSLLNNSFPRHKCAARGGTGFTSYAFAGY